VKFLHACETPTRSADCPDQQSPYLAGVHTVTYPGRYDDHLRGDAAIVPDHLVLI
jgi:hypothetical protein